MNSCMNCKYRRVGLTEEPCLICFIEDWRYWEPQPDPEPTAPIVEFFNDVNKHFTPNTKEDSK